MAETSKRRRAIPTLIAILAVAVAIPFLIVMRINAFFRRNLVKLDDLKFPILVVRPSGLPLYATWDGDTFRNISKTSTRIPTNGMILIDSDFQMVTLENVAFNKGDFAAIARALFPGVGYRYSFDLRKRDDAGLEAAMKCLLGSENLADDPANEAATRQELARQTTMDGILAVLHFDKPQPPVADTQPTTTEPATEPNSNEPLP